MTMIQKLGANHNELTSDMGNIQKINLALKHNSNALAYVTRRLIG